MFQFFPKIRGNICSSKCTTGVVDTGGKCKKSSIWKILIILFGLLWVEELKNIKIFAFKSTSRCLQPDTMTNLRRCCWYRWQFARGVHDTGGKFSAGIVDTGGKFATGVINTSGTGGKICCRCRWYRWQICCWCRWYRRQFCHWWHNTGGKSALTPVVHLDLEISPRIFEKIRNDPYGERWFMKKTWSKNLVKLSL